MILITGAAGSLGSELCKQLADREDVIALDIDEYGLWRLSQQLPVKTVCDSITRPELWNELDTWDIDCVINCAAVKHVWTVEQHEEWAELVNHKAIRYMYHPGRKLVHISTDKAVIPINKYGLSKLNAEKIALTLGGCVVRLVNIHWSRGCAEEIFLEQIKRGGPVMARDSRMKRYFTTIEQAAADVIAVMDNAGEGLYMPDPGGPVAIDDIIKSLIGFSQIEVVYAGAGQEEKLVEDLLTPYEKLEPVPWSDRISKVVRK